MQDAGQDGRGDRGGAPGASGRASVSRLGTVAALLAGSVLLSRVLGYLREIALANQVGAGADVDAYAMAFVVPELLNYLLAGGALAVAFIPIYNRILERDGEAAAGRLFQTVLGTLGALVTLFTLVLWFEADRIAAGALAGFDPERRALTVRLTRILLPAQIFFVTGGILRAVLMAHGRFRTQAAGPVIYNLCPIAVGLATGTVEGFAWGTLAGALLSQWVYPLWDMRNVSRVAVRFDLFDRHFRQYLWLALPLMLGLSLTTLDELYEKFFAQQLSVGSVAQLHFARRLMMAPVAVVGQAIAAAALPVLATLWASGRVSELNETLSRILRMALALGVFSGAACFAFAPLLVEVLFEHGRFSAEASAIAGQLLRIMALAVPAWVAQQVAVRAFYAREDTWRPMILSSVIALAAIPLYLVLREEGGAEGLALAGVIALTANGIATCVWMQLRFGGLDVAASLMSLMRSLAIAAPAAWGASWGAEWILTRVLTLPVGWLASATELALGGALFGALVLAGVFSLGDEMMRDSLRGVFSRLGLGGRSAEPRTR